MPQGNHLRLLLEPMDGSELDPEAEWCLQEVTQGACFPAELGQA